jgi:hypothetical protein
MALALVVERLLGLGKSSGGLLHDCFTSLLEASVRLKEVQEEKEGDEDDGEAENDDNDDDDEEIEDYDEV